MRADDRLRDGLRRSGPVRAAAAASIWAIRSVATRPGAMPLMRTGAISAVSDLMRPASPGRSRLDVVRPGIGSRADDDRMTRMAGAVARAQVGQGAADQPDGAPQRAVDGPLPGGLVELVEGARRRAAGVDEQQVQSAQRLDRGRHRARRPVLASRGPRRPRRRRPAADRGIEAIRRPRDERDPCALRRSAPPRSRRPDPPEPPPTRARAPSRPRSIRSSRCGCRPMVRDRRRAFTRPADAADPGSHPTIAV